MRPEELPDTATMASVVGLISIEIFGYRNGQAKVCHQSGQGVADHQYHAEWRRMTNNRIYIPQEDLL